MNNLVTRLITALIAVAIVIPALVFSYYGIWLFCAIVSMASLWEFLNLTRARDTHYRFIGIGMGAVLWSTALAELILPDLSVPGFVYWVEASLLLPLLLIATLFDPNEKRPADQIGGVVLAFMYVILPLYLLFDLAIPDGNKDAYNWQLPMGFLLLTWALDVSAYFVGKYVGGKSCLSG